MKGKKVKKGTKIARKKTQFTRLTQIRNETETENTWQIARKKTQ